MPLNILLQKINKTIPEDVFNKLDTACKYQNYQVKVADMLFAYHDRTPDFSLKENLLINLVKSAVQSHKYNPAELTGKTEELIKSLGLDEDVRRMLYVALFDNQGIYAASIQIHR
jgi:hypothetical protein